MNFFYENIFIIPCIAYIVATIGKGLYIYFTTNKSICKSMFATGGMPSQHSAVVSSLATAILLKNGIQSELFAISLFFAIIVIYDSCHLRYEAGLHAKLINKIIDKKVLYEQLGHTKFQVFVGTLLGMIVSYIFYII